MKNRTYRSLGRIIYQSIQKWRNLENSTAIYKVETDTFVRDIETFHFPHKTAHCPITFLVFTTETMAQKAQHHGRNLARRKRVRFLTASPSSPRVRLHDKNIIVVTEQQSLTIKAEENRMYATLQRHVGCCHIFFPNTLHSPHCPLENHLRSV